MFSTTPLQLHWNQKWILGTQYFQIPPNLAGFWQFLQCKLLPCLPTQFATACQLVAKLLATTCKNVSLVLQHSSALDPQAAWTWSSLNGLQSSYKRRVHTCGKRGPMAHRITCRQHSIRQDSGYISCLQSYLNTNLLIFHKPFESMSLQACEKV